MALTSSVVPAGSPPCFHGGAFFQAIGETFDHLERREAVLNADVLDAWFPPAPGVLSTLGEHLPWLLGTSPPTHAEGLVRTLARVRGVPEESLVPGTGSSQLIFAVLPRLVGPRSRVLILDPMYGEYAHVLEQGIGCRVDRLELPRARRFQIDPDELRARLAEAYDLVVLVNPNSPTGQHLPRPQLEALLEDAPERTRFWIDETYVEYAGPGQSLERFASSRDRVLVCKSMSKVYALSGARVGYLCTGPGQAARLRPGLPPWSVSLPAQVAAVRALEDPAYYAARWQETHALRAGLAERLRRLPGLEVLPSVANFLLCFLPEVGPDAATVIRRCRAEGLYLRDVASMGTHLGRHALRVAVKDAAGNERMGEILRRATALSS